MSSYDEIVNSRPPRTYESVNLNTEYHLLQVCREFTDEDWKTKPEVLKMWFDSQIWWLSLTTEERKIVFNREWKYD